MSRRLRFCHISTFYPPFSFGGDAVYLYRLANSLAAHGHEVDVIHCVDSYNLVGGRPARESLPNHPRVTIHTLHSRLGPISPLLSQQTGRPWLKSNKIRHILRSKRFDILHYHNTSLFGPKVLEMDPDYTGFIRLYTTHEHWLICPMHVLWQNNNRLCNRPRCLWCTLRHHRPPQWWRYTGLLPEAADHVDAFISPSQFTIDMHHQRGFGKPFTLLPYFAPAPDGRSPTATETDRPRPYFLFVGRLERIKGLQNVIPVFRNYREADLLVAGGGNYEPELRRLALGMENVVFLGRLPAGRLHAFYRDAVALIVPSICYEVFGIVVLEAFSNGTPVIANAAGALPEIIQESGGGLLYATQEELLASMERMRKDPELRRHCGENAYRKWSEQWSEGAHLRLYFNILNETARRKYGYIPWAEGGDSL